MPDVTRILQNIDRGDPMAADQLLPLVYDELRKLAAARLSSERSDHTLQATALVHEAYLRMVNVPEPSWNGRGHFFGAAAEAMRRILVENARRRKAEKHGGKFERIELSQHHILSNRDPDQILHLNEALDVLAQEDAAAAEIVKLRVFGGFSVEEAAELLDTSRATAYRQWTYGRAWLNDYLTTDDDSQPPPKNISAT